jgi:hypothetical protein
MQECAEQGVHTLLIIVNTGWFQWKKLSKRALEKWVFLLLLLINHPLSIEVLLDTLTKRIAAKNMRYITRYTDMYILSGIL